MLWLLVTLVAAPLVLADPKPYCYSTTAKPYMLTGTRTDYTSLPNKRLSVAASSLTEKCKPVMVWMISKNGASWPTQGEMKRTFSKLDAVRETVQAGDNYGKLCEKDRTLLESWKNQIPDDGVGGLHPAGEAGLREMAMRVKRTFPNLFKKPYSKENYVFQFGKDTWKVTYHSATSFAKGLFTQQPELEDYVRMEDHVEEVQLCKPADNQPHQSPDGPVDVRAVKPLLDSYDRIRERLGAPALSNEEMDSIFFACASEKAWDPKHPSPFCALLTPEDIKAQEYVDDIVYYYTASYKDTFGKQVACPLVRDMLQRFKLYAKNPRGQHPKGVFYFGQGKHVNVVTTALGMMFEPNYLGLNKMDPLRKYRTSKFLGYQGNLMAVLNECHSKMPGSKKIYKVKFFLNEVQIKGELSLDKLLQEYGSYIDEPTCNYDFCNENLDERQQYRKDHPYPVGVDPDKTLPKDSKDSSSSSSSSSDNKKVKGEKKKGHPWYWYIYGFPFMVITTILGFSFKPFSALSNLSK